MQIADGGSGVEVDEVRESIWSVPSRVKALYFALFSAQIIFSLVRLTLREARNPDTTWPDAALEIWSDLAPIAIASAAVTIVITDIGRTLKVLADWLRQKLITEPQQKKYQQGYADGLKAAMERQNAQSETPAETPKQSEQSN